MRRIHLLLPASFLLWLALPATMLWGQHREEAAVRTSLAVLKEITSIPLNGIPRSMFSGARGIAIVPNVIKGSFIIGARHGNGVLLVRADNGRWHAPVFISLTGGNVGWQVGVQSTDVILVFKTQKSVDGILSGKFTLGADAAAAAGPVGRQAAAATDERLRAEIYSYSRSRGLFAGVSIDGSVIQVNHLANAAYYRSPGPGQPVNVPPSAARLVGQVASLTATTPPPPSQAALPLPALAREHATDEATALRNDLARIAPELYRVLDPRWQAYLALPAQVFDGRGHPPAESLQRSLAHFETVRKDPRYRQLAERPEFHSTYGLLRHYVGARSENKQPLELPPPPAD